MLRRYPRGTENTIILATVRPSGQVEAIRALQSSVSEIVTRYFQIEADGSHKLDVALFQAAKPAR